LHWEAGILHLAQAASAVLHAHGVFLQCVQAAAFASVDFLQVPQQPIVLHPAVIITAETARIISILIIAPPYVADSWQILPNQEPFHKI